MAYKKRRRVSLAVIQFTFKGILYKVGDTFKGTKKESESLINKQYLKWQ